MSEVVTDIENYSLNLYDRQTEKALVIEKIVDISNSQKPSRKDRNLLFFTKDSRGRRIVLIGYVRPDNFIAMQIHFFVDQLINEMNVRACDDTLGHHAKLIGMTKNELINIIMEYAPAT